MVQFQGWWVKPLDSFTLGNWVKGKTTGKTPDGSEICRIAFCNA